MPALAKRDEANPERVPRIDVPKTDNIKNSCCITRRINLLFERLRAAQVMGKRVGAPCDVQRDNISTDVDVERVVGDFVEEEDRDSDGQAEADGDDDPPVVPKNIIAMCYNIVALHRKFRSILVL